MRLLTLTPVHIGSGETLSQLSYVSDKNSLYVMNMDKFFAILTEAQREAYFQWMDPILNRIVELDEKIIQTKDNQELKRQKQDAERKLSIGWFIENKLLQYPIIFAKKCLAYQIRFSSPPKRDVRSQIKDVQNNVYIPGSEIKGAVRTALLYSLLRDRENYEILKKSLNNFRTFFKNEMEEIKKLNKISDAKRDREFKKKIESKMNKIADAQSEDGLERKLLRGKEKDAKYDYFKLINVSDTNTASADRLQISTIKVIGSTGKIIIWAETLNPQTEFRLNFRVQERAFLDKLRLEALKDWLSVKKFFEACYYRSKEILEEEERYFSIEKNLLEMISRLKKENRPTSPILRLGGGQGFLGTTIGLKVKQNDPVLYDEAIREGVSSVRGWRTQAGRFPKTRRVIVDSNDNPVSLLGWVRLSED